MPITGVTILQYEGTRLKGERGALIAQAASACGKISETELQILNLDGDMRSEVTRDLRETEGKIAGFNEQRIAAEDQLWRVELCSRVTGMFHQLVVHTGAPAQVRLTSLNQRTTPELQGEVTQVAADLSRDQQSGVTYLVVRIGLPQTEVEKLGAQRLAPGMPAEAFIQAAPRTAISHLMCCSLAKIKLPGFVA